MAQLIHGALRGFTFAGDARFDVNWPAVHHQIELHIQFSL